MLPLRVQRLLHPAFQKQCHSAVAFSLALVLLSPLFARAEKVEQLNPRGYVNDFAGVLSPETEAELTALCAEVDRKTRAQIAVVTIQSLEGLSVEEFGHRLATRWGVGYKGDNRGVLILLAVLDRKYRIEVGYGLEPILPDGKVGGFGREMVPRLRQGDYGGALLHLTGRIAEVIARDRGVPLDSLRGPRPVPRPPAGSRPQAPSPQSDGFGEWFAFLYFGGQYLGFLVALAMLLVSCARQGKPVPFILVAIALFAIAWFAFVVSPEEHAGWKDYGVSFLALSFLCFWIGGTIASGFLAAEKNRTEAAWVTLALLFGSLPLLLLLWLPKGRGRIEWLSFEFSDGGSWGGGGWGGGGGGDFGGFGGGDFGGGGASGSW